MVFYRKYRGQTIEELDNKHVRETLFSVLAKNPPPLPGPSVLNSGSKDRRTHPTEWDSVPHAFLFAGPKGLGKTSSARIIAKVVNCVGRSKVKDQKSKTQIKNQKLEDKEIYQIEPCNKCIQCVSITNGTNLDVLEIDAASNRGIDEIRDLKDKIRLSPISAKKKIYIIDEVHMLTSEAFNALLKTLEEPPQHAMFILCTTEQHKVPPTILSRCFTIVFTKATDQELVRSLKRIIKGEKIEIDEEALLEIAHLGDGGFRDATKLLEEVTALSNGKKITKEFIDKTYQIIGIASHLSAMLRILEKRKLTEGLKLIETLVSQGMDMKYFTGELVEELHLLILQKVGVTTDEKTEKDEIKLGIEEIKQLIRLFSFASNDMKNSPILQLPLEIALIDWCKAFEKIEGEKKDEKKISVIASEKDEKTATKTSGENDVSVAILRKKVNNIAKIKALYGEIEQKTDGDGIVDIASVNLLNYSAEGEITPEWLTLFWKCIINSMKGHNHTTAGVLRGCSIKSFDRKDLIIETSYQFHKERLSHTQTMEVLQKICKELTGTPIGVSIVLKQK